ncbi:hypothetical protein SteCoe_15993 [Stentor coeruleus]|uniref:KHA domain-containing protein n=1 Tax=Stentor coeruleus TaxID=5963 RepID=A0A1R2C2D8_9CILI|nr:hypothetical protein SteCoe_15993 [Stentor coeruleus]
MADSTEFRIVAYKNTKNPSDGKPVLISSLWSKQQILKTCSDALGIKGKKIFNENGEEPKSFGDLPEGSALYISLGENFEVKTSSSKQTKSFVLCMLGAAAVGKSAVTQRYIKNTFVRDYDPTIEDYYKKVANVDGEVTSLSILDTAGMEDYYPLIDDWIDKKDGFVLVFSVEWGDSLTRLQGFNEKILHRYAQQGNKGPVVVVAGNKIDSLNRSVKYEEGKEFADKIGAKYFEVSAANGKGIDDMYSSIVKELKARKVVAAPVVKKHWYEKCSLL